jgi:hypothetical protein
MTSINLDLDHLPLTNMEQLKDKVGLQLHQQLQDKVGSQLKLGHGHRPTSTVAEAIAARAVVAKAVADVAVAAEALAAETIVGGQGHGPASTVAAVAFAAPTRQGQLTASTVAVQLLPQLPDSNFNCCCCCWLLLTLLLTMILILTTKPLTITFWRG